MDDQKEQLEMGSSDAEFWFGYDQWSETVDRNAHYNNQEVE